MLGACGGGAVGECGGPAIASRNLNSSANAKEFMTYVLYVSQADPMCDV